MGIDLHEVEALKSGLRNGFVGRNLLGTLLMHIRDELRGNSDKDEPNFFFNSKSNRGVARDLHSVPLSSNQIKNRIFFSTKKPEFIAYNKFNTEPNRSSVEGSNNPAPIHIIQKNRSLGTPKMDKQKLKLSLETHK